MKYCGDELKLENALSKEWIISNGIGGYASSTIVRSKYKKISWPIGCITFTTSTKTCYFIKIR